MGNDKEKTGEITGDGISFDGDLTAGGICGGDDHPPGWGQDQTEVRAGVVVNDGDLDVPEDSMDGRHGVRHYPDRLKTT